MRQTCPSGSQIMRRNASSSRATRSTGFTSPETKPLPQGNRSVPSWYQLCSRQTGQLRLIRDHGLLMLGVHLKSAIAYPKSPGRISRKYHSLLGNIMGKPCCITGECKRRDGCSGKTTARSPDSLGKRAQILFPAWRTADGTPLAPLRNNERF